MTTTTAPSSLRGKRGLSMVELMFALTLSTIILGAVFSAYGFIARSSVGIFNYSVMNAESRRGLEIFSRDARMARDITDFSSTGFLLTVPAPGGGEFEVRYLYVRENQTLFRITVADGRQAIVTDVADLVFERYNLQQNPAVNDLETKQIQLQLRMVRPILGQPITTDNVLSARFILRNKDVSN